MKLTAPREALLSACQLAAAVVPSRMVKPVLANLKAVAVGGEAPGEGRLTLMATDLEIGIRLEVAGLTIEEEGEALLPAFKLIDILREMREETMTLEAGPAEVVVRGGFGFFEMPGEDVVNFPDWPVVDEAAHHEVAAGELRAMIRRTVFAAADETARYSMTGVQWELSDSECALVATDGRRLARANAPATAHGGAAPGKGQPPVAPSKAMKLLERNLQDDEGELVKICVRPNDVLFRTGRAVVYSRLVEGRFPDYKQVMPKKMTVKVALETTPFHMAVRQAAIMSDDTKRVTFSFEKNKLTMEAQGANAGRSKVDMPVSYDGKFLKINFNPVFVIEMLKVLPPEAELTLELIDAASPALFRSGENYVYLIMPLT